MLSRDTYLSTRGLKSQLFHCAELSRAEKLTKPYNFVWNPVQVAIFTLYLYPCTVEDETKTRACALPYKRFSPEPTVENLPVPANPNQSFVLPPSELKAGSPFPQIPSTTRKEGYTPPIACRVSYIITVVLSCRHKCIVYKNIRFLIPNYYYILYNLMYTGIFRCCWTATPIYPAVCIFQ